MQDAFPVTLAAIDAGSNAIRIVVSRAEGKGAFQQLAAERVPLRLGQAVFAKGKFDPPTIAAAVDVFRHFRDVIDAHGVRRYRAVATSAAREAQNRDRLIEAIRKHANIELEVIDGVEEARLVTTAVIARLPPGRPPRVIVDMGGGSFEVNLLRRGVVVDSRTFPLGAVRLMEELNLRGQVAPRQVELLRARVVSTLAALEPKLPYFQRGLAAGCGGNFEALARIAPGLKMGNEKTLDCYHLFERLRDITSRDVPARMERFKVRKDRAEVLPIAAIVISSFARCFNLGSIVVPGVGVREGILAELAAATERNGSSSTATDASPANATGAETAPAAAQAPSESGAKGGEVAGK